MVYSFGGVRMAPGAHMSDRMKMFANNRTRYSNKRKMDMTEARVHESYLGDGPKLNAGRPQSLSDITLNEINNNINDFQEKVLLKTWGNRARKLENCKHN